MTPCTIQLKKGRDGKSTLTVIRADGSRTWSKVHPSFPEHDLSHLAVESTLGASEGFFGLIASGWSIDDFAAPGAASRLPAEAMRVEMTAGQLDLSNVQGTLNGAEEVNERIALAYTARGWTPPAPLTAEQLATIRRMHAMLVAEWRALAPGGTMEAGFPYAK